VTENPARVRICAETPSDRKAIAQLNDRAFGGTFESELIDRLRADGLVAASLVAEDEGRMIGHILLSRLDVTAGKRKLNALALGQWRCHPSGSAKVSAPR
jgi:putative acetyltransferase